MAGQWHRVDDDQVPDEGRVRSVEVDGRTVALARCGGRLGALENHCPHQGGPLGEGSIEKGLLRCPWHGYDYDPITGQPPGGFSDAVPSFPVEERADGVYVELPDVVPPRPHGRRGARRDARRVRHHARVRHGRPLEPRLRRRAAQGRGARRDHLHRHPARGRGGVRGKCVRQAHRPPGGLLRDRRAQARPTCSPGCTTRSSTARRWSRSPGRCRRRCAAAARSRTSTCPACSPTSPCRRQVVLAGSNHAELAALAVKRAIDGRGVAHLVLPDEVQVLPSEQPAAQPGGPVHRAPDPARRRRPRLVLPTWCATPAGRSSSSAMAPAQRAPRCSALAERLGAPVLTTFKAKGLIPDTHPLGAGVLGRSGTPVASWLMNESDLLLVVGASFSNHTGIAAYKPIVQIDDAHAAIGRFDAVTEHLLGDAALTVSAPGRGIADAEGRGPDATTSRSDGRSGGRRRRAGSPTTVASACRRPRCSTRSARHLPADAVVTVDVGNHAYSLGRYLESAGQPVLMSGYLGSIGFGYPAAIGRVGGRAGPTDPGRHRRRRIRPVQRRDPHRGQVRHPDQASAARQRLAGQDQQGTARRRLPGLAHLPAQPRLGRLRRTVRRHRHPGRTAATNSTTRSRALFAADGPALLCVQQDAQLV